MVLNKLSILSGHSSMIIIGVKKGTPQVPCLSTAVHVFQCTGDSPNGKVIP